MPAGPATHLLAQDLIYVGGGSVVSLLGVWRAHGLDEVMREAWERGIVLCGLSAGSLCWFADAVTAFHGPPQRLPGLGLLRYSNCVHYDGEPARRESYHRFVSEGWLQAMRRATGQRCISAANRSRASSPHDRRPAPAGSRRSAGTSPRSRCRSAGSGSPER